MSSKKRLLQYLENKGVKNSLFYKVTGLSNGFLDKNENINSDKVEIIISKYPDINLYWLITGEGDMLASVEPPQDVVVKDRFDLSTDYNKDLQRIPLYELEASAGLISLFVNSKDFIPLDYITIPDLPPCDGALHVRGDSMYPILKSGDIILYKAINDREYGILWGEMYIVSYIVDGEEYIVVKYIQKSTKKGCVKLVSHNQDYSPQDIPLSYVQAIAIIKASVRYNTLK